MLFSGSKLTQLGRHSNITCLGLSVLTGKTKESILHLATTLFKLSFWGLKYSYLNGQFFIFLTLYPCWTTRQRPTCYWAIALTPPTVCNPTHFSPKKAPQRRSDMITLETHCNSLKVYHSLNTLLVVSNYQLEILQDQFWTAKLD